ncbi:DNA-binding transcriptional regulator, HxlR family [Izhakiella capsodis]|uniref:DNA-binding transcriptional regulator, HxlR family n=1 Tax=Izhakiella capsodis TaxID=1367852 RepID=A0A1I4VBU1_9GAMM|nr:helix-turn-helix domain-containing protein [Izhakiella capsodis]SFM98624.1 DNA-binding transcriptional regulator, HxlR family [Izhakiella capsodis]
MTNSLDLKIKKGDLLNADCPSRDILKRLLGRWSLLVLIALKQETLRFSALRRRIGGVSERMLAQTLRHMEEDGFIVRIAHDVVPPHVEYYLTPLGCEAETRVALLAEWLENNITGIMAHRQAFSAESGRHEEH